MLNMTGTKVHLAVNAVDFRKQIDGLCIIVTESFKLDAFSQELFVFCNKSRNKVKALRWDGTGFWLYLKRLEKGKFKWPEAKGSRVMEISERELRWILDGLTLNQPKAHKQVTERAII